jgi:hypothetical protein
MALAQTIRALLIPMCAVLMFLAFSSIATLGAARTLVAEHTPPVVVPSPERPCALSLWPCALAP